MLNVKGLRTCLENCLKESLNSEKAGSEAHMDLDKHQTPDDKEIELNV